MTGCVVYECLVVRFRSSSSIICSQLHPAVSSMGYDFPGPLPLGNRDGAGPFAEIVPSIPPGPGGIPGGAPGIPGGGKGPPGVSGGA